ncbi:PTS sugar transporter subunit IIA [Mobiluncus curtisii]|uniref:PTS sugar transporter subunit IIA n=1 Tax=Mobiluncus curtisii TaxID=2051 RepID=UPI001470261D|nr:PTS sugar transporter subunit IIA [Mobiluncus curtisii]NMW47001.1 PTS sugar transporter subunit IIA [Mobiluncus curtisii]
MLRKGSASVAGKGKAADAVSDVESDRISGAQSRTGKAKQKAQNSAAAKKSAKRPKDAKAPETAGKRQHFARFLSPGWYERFLQYLFVAILVLCASEMSLRLGQGHILGDQGFGKLFPAILPVADIFYYVGTTVESYFPLVVAFLLAFAAAKRANAAIGLAVLGGWAGYLGATMALSRYSAASSQGEVSAVDLGLMGGILVGFLVAGCWSEFRFRKIAPWARMVSGIPLVVMISATGGVVLGILVGVCYQLLYLLIAVAVGTAMVSTPGPLGAAIYGLLHPFAEVAGFSSLLNVAPFNLYGRCQTTQGDTLNGSYRCFVYGGTQMEGQQALFLAGGYPVVAFGLAALFLVLWLQLKGSNRQYWRIMYWFLIASTFVVGADKPALYLLFFAAPGLLLVHAGASAFAYALTAVFGVTIGWAGGPGMLDLLRWMGTGAGILVLLILGVIYAAIYVMIAIFTVKAKGKRLRLGGFGVSYITKPFMGIPNNSGDAKFAPVLVSQKSEAVNNSTQTGASTPVSEDTSAVSPAPEKRAPAKATAAKPVVTKATTAKVTPAKPAAVQPTPAKPVVATPAPTKSTPAKVAPTKPVPNQPGIVEPVATQPVAAQPVITQPEATREPRMVRTEPAIRPAPQSPQPAVRSAEPYSEVAATPNPAYTQQGYAQNPYGYQAPSYPEGYPAYPEYGPEYNGGYNPQLYGYQGNGYAYPTAYNSAAMPQNTPTAQNFSAPQPPPRVPVAPAETHPKANHQSRSH